MIERKTASGTRSLLDGRERDVRALCGFWCTATLSSPLADGFAGFEGMDFKVGNVAGEAFQCFGRPGEGGERSVVHGDDMLDVEQANGDSGFSGTHGIEIAD